jgi:hypothetical protein
MPGPKIQVNNKFHIKTNKMIINENFEVPIPMSHLGIKPIQCRLLSKTRRPGMVKFKCNFKNNV